MNRTSFSAIFSTLLFSLITSGQAHAVTFCANNATQLRSAFSLAGSNGQDDEIRIRNVVMPASGSLSVTGTYVANITDGKSIDVSGGWTDNSCSIPSDDPTATVLLPAANRRTVEFSNAAPVNGINPVVKLHNLTLEGNGPNSQLVGCAASATGRMKFLFQRVIVTDVSCGGATVAVTTWGESVLVRGNLFTSNSANDATVLRVYADMNGNSPTGITFSNNTLVGNTTATSTELVRISTPTSVYYENNVLWDNAYPSASGQPNELYAGVGYQIRNNLFQYPLAGLLIGNQNLNANPMFASLTDLRPTRSSPLRNAGTINAVGLLTSLDLQGNDRVKENAVDIGAYEYDPNQIFSSGFD